jgi:FtsH-binding integral membrane protein
MRYLRSWLFDIGLVLIIAAPAVAYFVPSRSRTYVVSQPGALIRASYINYDLSLPIGLAVSGLIVVAIAIRGIPRRFN